MCLGCLMCKFDAFNRCIMRFNSRHLKASQKIGGETFKFQWKLDVLIIKLAFNIN